MKRNALQPDGDAVAQIKLPIISMVRHAAATKAYDVSADVIVKAIQSCRWEKPIKEIRSVFADVLLRTGDRKAAKQAVDGAKKNLAGILWSGRFSRRANDTMIQHSGLLCADLDQLGKDKLWDVRRKLIQSEHLYALFRSPTGDGLKAVFCVSADVSTHLASFRAVEQHVLQLSDTPIDYACKDVARICFVSFDPFLYSNTNAREIAPLPQSQDSQSERASRPLTADITLRQCIAVEFLGEIQWVSETHGFCACPGKHLHTTGDARRDCEIHLDAAPTIHCFHNHCQGIRDALNRELRSRIAKVERGSSSIEREQQLTSLNSLGLNADYPPPLGEAAFHGLAGEIVRLIEPHTEADPAALLFQFLAAFGNIIGVTAYMMADGARHYLVLFIVLVGPTSKGRKGTSWNQIAHVLKHVDENWLLSCVSNGLSSGEGLIWAVRDPITERKPVKQNGRHTGEYETIITDHGVTDKRLLVSEGEFANVLKVMAREGSTLSPLIRAAWDTGSLRSMTKNSPARATGAHISIVGHITRDELRRLLTQTESANGFGNRFNWVAVKRSKCLPEGGAIETVNFDDVVARLHSAIEFSKNVGELKRSEEARELWRQVYPELSEANPGMSGAVTSRAEAQVMRFGMIYALLDRSRLIERVHLRAALALWHYCEQSARWIFGSGTGDKNADRILAALKQAGGSGLTKAQISEDVFNRHATRFEIDEALRLLHALKLADCIIERTDGRSAERWFCANENREKSERSQQSSRKAPDNSLISQSPPPEISGQRQRIWGGPSENGETTSETNLIAMTHEVVSKSPELIEELI